MNWRNHLLNQYIEVIVFLKQKPSRLEVIDLETASYILPFVYFAVTTTEQWWPIF